MATKKESGCLVYLSIMLISIGTSTFIHLTIGSSLLYTFLFIIFVLSWVYGRFINTENKSTTIKYLVYSILLTITLFWFKNLSSPLSDGSDYNKDISEDIYREKILEQGDSITLLSHNRNWSDNYGRSYQSTFSIRENDYHQSRKNYNTIKDQGKTITWGQLYQYLSDTDTPSLDLILEKLKNIKETNKLNQLEFAEMVVTFVQDIPYSFVFGEECQNPEDYEEAIRSVLKKCPECCIGNIPFGVQNPTGFMGNLKGDCDTRTVLIYALLSYFGYDVAILNSDYYRHSILGLNIPAKGTYKAYKGRRYYLWETTNKFFTLGTLPNNFNNINHWSFVLIKQ